MCDFALRLARQRKAQGKPGRVTNVDKANVFTSMAFWRQVFDERAQAFPDVPVEHAYVDAMALNLVMKPWAYDVLVTENMFGDILSDLIAALAGGMGMAPSADIGDDYALFQPAHGTAPDIVGQGIANPTATILSAAMMLDWLAERHGDRALSDGARAIEASLAAAFAKGVVRPREFGGSSSTADIVRAVVARACDDERAHRHGRRRLLVAVPGRRLARCRRAAGRHLQPPRRKRRGAGAALRRAALLRRHRRRCSTPNGRRWSTCACRRWRRSRPCARPSNAASPPSARSPSAST